MITFCWAASFFTSFLFGIRVTTKCIDGFCGHPQIIMRGEWIFFSLGMTGLFTLWKMGL